MFGNLLASGRPPQAEAAPRWRRLLWACLVVSLGPNLAQIQVALDDELTRPEREVRGAAVDNLSALCLPVALLCIARLLTEGACRPSDGGQGPAGHGGSLGLRRVLALAAVLGVLFFPTVYACSILTLGARLMGASIAFGFGFLSALAISRFLLDFWGFVVGAARRPRPVAAAVYGFMAAAWVLSLLSSFSACG